VVGYRFNPEGQQDSQAFGIRLSVQELIVRLAIPSAYPRNHLCASYKETIKLVHRTVNSLYYAPCDAASGVCAGEPPDIPVVPR